MSNELSEGKESQGTERTNPFTLENLKIRETPTKLEEKKEKEQVLMEVHKMHGQAGPHYPGSHGPRRQHSKTQRPR